MSFFNEKWNNSSVLTKVSLATMILNTSLLLVNALIVLSWERMFGIHYGAYFLYVWLFLVNALLSFGIFKVNTVARVFTIIQGIYWLLVLIPIFFALRTLYTYLMIVYDSLMAVNDTVIDTTTGFANSIFGKANVDTALSVSGRFIGSIIQGVLSKIPPEKLSIIPKILGMIVLYYIAFIAPYILQVLSMVLLFCCGKDFKNQRTEVTHPKTSNVNNGNAPTEADESSKHAEEINVLEAKGVSKKIKPPILILIIVFPIMIILCLLNRQVIKNFITGDSRELSLAKEASYEDLDPYVWFLLNTALEPSVKLSALGFSSTTLDVKSIFSNCLESINKNVETPFSDEQMEVIRRQVEAACKLPWASDRKAAEAAYKELPVYIFGRQGMQDTVSGIVQGALGKIDIPELAVSIEGVVKSNAATEGQGFGISSGTYVSAGDSYVTFSQGNHIEIGAGDKPQKSGVYIVQNDSGIDFLFIGWNDGTSEKLLFLTANVYLNNPGEFLFLYKSDGEQAYFAGAKTTGNGGAYGARYYNTSASVTASSYLAESGQVYSVEKLGGRTGECWVEGAAGSGINETLTLLNFPNRNNPVYISSGFVSYEKPHLYQENARIKMFKVSNESGQSMVVDLADTPHFQAIDMSGILKGGTSGSNITLEILEVYSGSKYTDTCVNALYSYSAGQ